MKFKSTIPLMVSSAVLLAACGGGSSTPAATTVFKVTGTVPGTLIEAFCEDGSYHSVSSQTNATDKHPFVLELPTDMSCRMVMTTNENDPDNKVITPIKLVNTQSNGSIAFSLDDDIDIGHVNLATDRNQMSTDDNKDGVEDSPLEVSLDDTASSSTVIITSVDPMDDDNDGIINVYEDDDNDGINNHDDDDDDNDGIPDIDDLDHGNDLDGDGIDNARDTDDDNDGYDDGTDSDDDNDGVSDSEDSDDDNDGIDDSVDPDEVNDLDDDGVQNGYDDDDDNDGIDDISDDDDDNDGIDDKDDDDDDNDGVDDSLDDDYVADSTNTAVTVATTTPQSSSPTAGRLLAAQCAQCHGTDGVSKTSIDSLAGETRDEIISEMLDMQSENFQEIMHKQGNGYSTEQIAYIADYFAGLPKPAGGNE